MSADELSPLHWALSQLARQQGLPLDAVRLQAVLKPMEVPGRTLHKQDIDRLVRQLGWETSKALARPDRAHLPLLVHSAQHGWGLLTDGQEGQSWTVRTSRGPVSVQEGPDLNTIVRLVPPDLRRLTGEDSFSRRLFAHLREFKGTLGEAITASLLINVLTAVVSFFAAGVRQGHSQSQHGHPHRDGRRCGDDHRLRVADEMGPIAGHGHGGGGHRQPALARGV